MPSTPSSLHTLGDLLKYEGNRNITRKVCTLTTNATPYLLGTVLGLSSVNTTVAGATVVAGTNTGNGTVTKDGTAPVGLGAISGVYRIVITEAAIATTPAVPAEFTVYSPTGAALATGAAGTTYSGQIKFAITIGATPYAVGDSWTFTVAAITPKAVRLSFADVADGSHEVAGVLLYDVDATLGDVSSVMLVRGPAILARGMVRFAAGFSTPTLKAPVFAKLESMGIAIGEDGI